MSSEHTNEQSNNQDKQQNNNPQSQQNNKPKETRYYKSKIAGLSFHLGGADPSNPVAPLKVRFVPYFERYQGDRIRVGYLETDDSALQARLEADANVERIEKAKDYKEAISKAERAPY